MTYLRSQNNYVVYKTNLHTTASTTDLTNMLDTVPQIIHEKEIRSTPRINIQVSSHGSFKTNTKKQKIINTTTTTTTTTSSTTTKPTTTKPTITSTTSTTSKPTTTSTTSTMTVKPTTTSTTTVKPILSTSNCAYVTYHSYFENQPLTSVACSDGSNGLIQKTGYTSLTNELWPYVTAWSDIVWNSPKCGACIHLQASNGNSVNVIAIDGCGKSNTGETHFDLSEEAFLKLFGNKDAGSGYVEY